MIIPVKKYLLLGAKEDLDRFFLQVQQKGIVEFIPAPGSKMVPLPIEAQNIVDALKILRRLPVKKKYEGPVHEGYAGEVSRRVLEVKAGIEKLSEEKRLLQAEIVRITPFGDFSLDDIDFIEKEGKREIQFFCQKTLKRNKESEPPSLIWVSSSAELDYFISIGLEAEKYSDMIEMRIDRPLGELQTHLAFVTESLQQFQAELKGFAGHIELLQDALIEHLNEHSLVVAKKRVAFPIENSLFSVEAWIPENKTGVLYALLQGMAIHCEPILVEKTDRVPTRMENSGFSRIGEDLVKIYDVPSSTDNDPSLPVLIFFSIFFSMIVADAGYGLIYLAITLFFKYRFPQAKAAGKRMIKLGTILSSTCIVWGTLTGSFFGIEMDPKGWSSKVSIVEHLAVHKADYHLRVKDAVYQSWVGHYPQIAQATTGEEMLELAAKEDKGHLRYEMRDTFSENILLEFSLFLGVIHIAYSLIRYLRRHLSHIGWMFFLVGGYLYFPSLLGATSMVQFLGVLDPKTSGEIGLQLVYSGLILVVFFGVIQKKWYGLIEVTHVTQVFGDVLSYLRLYALGLAGVLMAETFNTMGMTIHGNYGLIPACFVILVGHSININLAIVEGTVHGLRLNFIEWYHYSFEGGGRLFRPLIRLHSKEHH